MEHSISTINAAYKKALVMKASRVNYDVLQPGGALARQLNHDKPHWPKPVTGLGVTCQLLQWASGEKVVAQVQACILCNVNLCVKCFALFHSSRALVEDRENIASSKKSRLSRGENMNNQNWKGDI